MNRATDIGPLSWVKSEIDAALDQAAQGLADQAIAATASAETITTLQAARDNLHQAHGALAIVGLSGVTEFSLALEALLAALATGEPGAAETALAATREGIAALRAYLDELMAGAPHQALRLFPVYRELILARGLPAPSPDALFFPDLTQRPPRRAETPPALSEEALRARLRAARLGFDRGLVKWLKGDAKGVSEMKATLNMVELTRATPAARACWWAALGVLDALGADGLPDLDAAKRFLLRLAAQMKRLSESLDPEQAQAPDELLREALYLAATATRGHAALTIVRAAYRLDELLPERVGTRTVEPPDARIRHLRESIAAAKAEWKRLTDGAIAALPPFHQHVTALAETAADMPPAYAKLTAAIRDQADLLRRDPALHNDVLAREMATALLLADTALDNLPALNVQFAEQTKILIERLNRAARCEPLDALTDPALVALAGRAQVELLRATLARDIGAQLAAVEQTLDAFFRDSTRLELLTATRQPLQRALDALGKLGETRAMETLTHCAAIIEGYAQSTGESPTADFKELARQLAALGLYVTRLAREPAAGELFAPGKSSLPVDEDAAQDTELLAIFLHEARDVLADVAVQLPRLHAAPTDRDALTAIRRGFHTLKGSGRMVGLHALGEAAWAVEQVLNRWLDETRAATVELLAMLDLAAAAFNDWVTRLGAGDGEVRGHDELLRRCAALGANDVVARAAMPTDAVPPAPTFSTAPDAAAMPASSPARDAPAKPNDAGDVANTRGDPPPETTPPVIQENAAASASVAIPPVADTAEVLTFPEPAPLRIGPVEIAPLRYHQFLDTAREQLAILQERLGRDLPPDMEVANAARNLLRDATATGFTPLHHLAQALDATLARFIAANTAPAEAQRFVLARCAGALAGMLGAIAEQRMPGEEHELTAALTALQPEPGMSAFAPFIADRRGPRIEDALDPRILPLFLEESVDLLREIGEHLRAWRAAPDDAAIAQAMARALHTLKGSARMAGAMVCGEILHALETRVGEAAAAPAVADLDALETSFDRLCGMIDDLRQAPATTVTPAVAETAAPNVQPLLRVRADLVDQWVNEASEIAITRARLEGEMRGIKAALRDLGESVARLRAQLREVEIQAETQMLSHREISLATQAAQTFDPLELDRFTRFQETTRMLAESVDDVAAVQHTLMLGLEHADTALAAQARLNRGLSQRLLSARMVPFDSIAERLHRVVRQAARDAGKRVNLDIHAGQTEIDRAVLEKVAGPIEHLLRNGVAHGIEDEATRQRLGKPPLGQLTLTLAQTGNDIRIEIGDDGAGLDFASIRQRASERSLLAPDAPVDEAALTQLLFHAGFSTAAEVTPLSGRGIGLGVVKNDINGLGGRIDVSSTPGQGARFVLILPMTLAINLATLVRIGERHYAIPTTMIEQAGEQPPEVMRTIRQAGGIEAQGAHYPWYYLPRLLGEDNAAPPAQSSWLLRVRSGGDCLALEVDDIDEAREIVLKPLGPQLSRVPGLLGATVLADGEIVLLFNPLTLLARLAVRPAAVIEEGGAPPLATTAPPSTAPTIMVIDDSLTVRKITGRLLARHGYRVLTARDGVDALEQLRAETPAVLLVDIEMPRMDGFELTRAVRADARLAHLPIIMITSRIADKHRQHAFEAGVNHYLGKPYNEDELLRLIADFTAQEKS